MLSHLLTLLIALITRVVALDKGVYDRQLLLEDDDCRNKTTLIVENTTVYSYNFDEFWDCTDQTASTPSCTFSGDKKVWETFKSACKEADGKIKFFNVEFDDSCTYVDFDGNATHVIDDFYYEPYCFSKTCKSKSQYYEWVKEVNDFSNGLGESCVGIPKAVKSKKALHAVGLKKSKNSKNSKASSTEKNSVKTTKSPRSNEKVSQLKQGKARNNIFIDV